MRVGIRVFGAASIASGILNLVWGEFEPAHQPIQAWGNHIPGVRIFAYIGAMWLIAGGAALLWHRSRQYGAQALTILYAAFVLFPIPRFYTAPHYLGFRPLVFVGLAVTVCEQLVLFLAAAIAWRSPDARTSPPQQSLQSARWAFGFCSIVFGIGHLSAIHVPASMIPKWMPLDPVFWSALTGIAFLLAGLAIISEVLDVLAAKLLGLMLLLFNPLVLVPLVFAAPRDHVSWGGNAYNLSVVGAAWIVAEWLADRGQKALSQSSAGLAEPSLT